MIVKDTPACSCSRSPKARFIPGTLLTMMVLLSLTLAGCKKVNWNKIEENQLRIIALACESFHPSNSRYPNDLAELVKFDPYASSFTVDVWSTPVQYSLSANTYVVRSAGPDRKFGTVDDIVIRREDLDLGDEKGG